MKRTHMILGVCLAALLALAQPAVAQTTGDISDRVTDNTGAVLPGATITLTSVATESAQVAVSTETGAFRFANLTPGTYHIQFELTGFRPWCSTTYGCCSGRRLTCSRSWSCRRSRRRSPSPVQAP